MSECLLGQAESQTCLSNGSAEGQQFWRLGMAW
jgi:hypothetical protein